MAHVTYACDEHGVISGMVSNDSGGTVQFSISTDTIMQGKDHGLLLLDEVVAAAIKELDSHPEETGLHIRIYPVPAEH